MLDSVSHAIGERNLRTLILQYESAIHIRLPGNMRVQYTDAYPAKGVIHRRISCNKWVQFTDAYPGVG